MTGSEDHRGTQSVADLSEVSHTSTPIITDLIAVAGTACHRSAARGRHDVEQKERP
jgi:hypothetical protein